MPLARKGSRSIMVDGVKYRWVVSPDSGYVVVVIEAYERAGQRIEVYVNSDINRMWDEFPRVGHLNQRVVKPTNVRSIIQQALAWGWQPDEKRVPMVFDLGDAGRLARKQGKG